ncbi:MAG: ABC-2 transporter permease [Clostridiales bacterium]|nr:ABC-2 transporter permease [Clostridiales bacterium]
MKGLLRKDFYMTVKYCKAYLLIVVIFAAVSASGNGNLFFTFYPVLLASMIPVTLISYDERSKWNGYAEALPYTRRLLVSVKYVMALLSLVLSLVLCVGVQLVGRLYLHAFDPAALLQLTGTLFSVGLLSPAILLPVIFKFGAEKGRIVYYAVVILMYIALACLFGLFSDDGLPLRLPVSTGLLCLAAGAALLFVLSWALSVYFYRRREL